MLLKFQSALVLAGVSDMRSRPHRPGRSSFQSALVLAGVSDGVLWPGGVASCGGFQSALVLAGVSDVPFECLECGSVRMFQSALVLAGVSDPETDSSSLTMRTFQSALVLAGVSDLSAPPRRNELNVSIRFGSRGCLRRARLSPKESRKLSGFNPLWFSRVSQTETLECGSIRIRLVSIRFGSRGCLRRGAGQQEGDHDQRFNPLWFSRVSQTLPLGRGG